MDLAAELAGIDIYLLDQLLRGRVAPGATVLDAGCGGGRNLAYFLKHGYDVRGIDPEPEAIAAVRDLARALGADEGDDRFRVEALEDASLAEGSVDLVICNAVLHFARDTKHFQAMADALRRVLRPGGLAFCRLASTIGIESSVAAIPGRERWYDVPDGSQRFLVDLDFLLAETGRLHVELADPIKTVNVQGLRCMTNWVWWRP